MSKTVIHDKPILIAGAGPAGLALAQGLRKRGIPYRIFDRDQDGTARTQGWAVAIQQAKMPFLNNLPDDLPPLETASHLYGTGLKTNLGAYDGISGDLTWSVEEGENFFRADREKLRLWLLNNINVEWSKKIDKYEENENGVTAYFVDGTSAQGCALIGAEGYRSEVRNQLVSDSAVHGTTMDTALGKLTVSREKCEEFFTTMARSVVAIQLPETFLFAGLHNLSDDGQTAYWYWMAFHPQSASEKGRSISDWSSTELYNQAKEWLAPMHPKFKDLIDLTKPEHVEDFPDFASVWFPPEQGFSSSKVTLIGDAAHKQPPLGGQGVNMAFLDTVELCNALDSEDSIAKALSVYDAKVVERARKAVADSLKWPVVPAPCASKDVGIEQKS